MENTSRLTTPIKNGIEPPAQENHTMSNTIAKTIIEQIRAQSRLAFAAWGAKDFVDMGDGLKFKTSGLVKRKCWVYIKYDHGSDTYEIIYARIRKSEWIVDSNISNVYFDQLVDMIDHYVG
jgi:hypothetical protein